ncbi:MAG: hypothetical protein ACXADD_15080 [Candidatus Thorarchaeota archaeon]|jgi:hypothetical protein
MQVRKFKILSTYVAPWALAHEEVPVHVFIDPSSNFEAIKVYLPRDMSILDYFNIEQVRKAGQVIVIDQLGSPGFFGFTVVLEGHIDETHLSKEIVVEFIENNTILDRISLIANFYRPWMELIEATTSITLLDDSDTNELIHAKLRLRGFGDVRVGIEHRRGEKFQFELEAIFQELIQRAMAASFRTKYSDDLEYDNEAPIDSEYVVQEATRFWNEILHSSFHEIEAQELLSKFREWIENPSIQEEIKSIITSQIEDIAMSMLLSYPRRFPNDRVDYRYGEPRVAMTKVADALGLRFRYWDSVGNEYEPVEFDIDVHDKRRSKKPIELKINTQWRIEPYNLDRRCA